MANGRRGTPHGSRIPADWPREAVLPAYACTNCGFWQKSFAEPGSCPVCTDFRHVLPEGGWEFLTPEGVDRRERCAWDEVAPGVWRYSIEPPLGISPSGYVIVRPEGNVGFEGAGWYSDGALDHIESLGGISYLSASHPHTYGALWRLVERFEPEVVLHEGDLGWATAFAVTWPFEGRLEIGSDVEMLHTGGHFDGHSMLCLRSHGIVFAGDAIKLELADERTADGISTHKAFVRRVPLTFQEARRYRDVFASVEFSRAFTPFEQPENVGKEEVLRLMDAQLEDRPFVEVMPL